MLDEILIYEFRNVVPWKSADLFHHFASKSTGEAWYSVERSPVRLLSHLAPCTRVRWHRLQLEARGVRFLSNGYRRRIKKKKRKWRKKHGYKSTNVVYNEKMDTADGYKERIWGWVGVLAVLPVICQGSIVGETFLHPKSGKTFVIPPMMVAVVRGLRTMFVKIVPRSR